MKKILLVIILSWGSLSFSRDLDFVVKITSSVCGYNKSKMMGSGSLFNYNGSVYVLTSEHVLYHSKGSRYCHQVNNSMLNESAQLLFADWGRGIALLKLNIPPSDKFLKFPEDFVQNPFEKVLVAGVPYAEVDTHVSDTGKIITFKGKRLLSPIITESMEIVGASGEFGMSGGAVLGQNGDEIFYLGLLSHQILKMVPGSSTQTTEWDESQKYHNQLLSIKSSDIKVVLDSYFSSESSFKVSFYRDPMGQLNRLNSIVGHGLVYTPIMHSKDPAGTDVNFPDPIGGVDPIGIGGTEETKINYSSLMVSYLSGKEEFETMDPLRFLTNFTKSLSKIREILLLRKEVELPYLVYQNIDMNLQAAFARNGNHFFHLLAQENYSAVVRNLSSDNSDKIQQLGKKNLELLDIFKIESIAVQNQQYFVALTTLSRLAKENNLDLANCDLVNSIVERNPKMDSFWQELLSFDFESSTKILQNTKYFARICK